MGGGALAKGGLVVVGGISVVMDGGGQGVFSFVKVGVLFFG